jgi:hypothetical protein
VGVGHGEEKACTGTKKKGKVIMCLVWGVQGIGWDDHSLIVFGSGTIGIRPVPFGEYPQNTP